MPSRINIPRWLPVALALAGVLVRPGSARADFQITYVFTDDEGNPEPQLRLNSTDMSMYSNQASCQCGHLWGVRVFLNNAMGTSLAGNTRVRTFVGSQCGDGQQAVGQQYYPCVKIFDGQANEYDDGGILLSFEQIWLSSRVQNLDAQAVEIAEPRNPCDQSQTGGGGIWICVESNGLSDCQAEEFVVMGDSSVNSSGNSGMTPAPMDMGGMAPVTGIAFDYTPPQSAVTGFVAEPGDGAVVISWTRSEVPDINGFRVLCADMEGNAPITKITSTPTGRSRTNGKLYYTAENLCPGEVVYTPPDPDPPASSDTGTDTGRDSESDTESDAGTSSAIDAPELGGGWSMATTGTSTGTSGAATDTGGSATDTGGSASGTAGSGSDSGSTTDGDATASVLDSLDWKYVCSDHLSSSGTSIRIDGLENGKQYQFIVVAYDEFGNPEKLTEAPLLATPIETSDFWEQCEQQGDLCGHGGFCSCRSDPAPAGAAWLGAGLVLLGLARRRRSPR